MTRNEAKVEIALCPMHETLSWVDKIYDDFESRVCGNCKWYRPGTNNTNNWCAYGTSIGNNEHGDAYVTEDFGCNEFKRKEDV